jgi:hypothetical protein
LVAVAVDFAKHGECVTEKDYDDIKVNEFPHFMEKKDHTVKSTYKSETILGKLYDQVDTEQFYKTCIKKEHNFSLLLKYHLNRLIIPHNDFEFHKYLYDAYDAIVRPMIEELKTLMFDFSITNEAELFCSTLSFRMNTSIG